MQTRKNVRPGLVAPAFASALFGCAGQASDTALQPYLLRCSQPLPR